MAQALKTILIVTTLIEATALWTSCRTKHVILDIKIHAINIHGRPVIGAEVNLDHKKLGITNTFGDFQTSINLARGKLHKVTISKNDDQYYYSPYFELINLKTLASNEITITPTLYQVPKPNIKISKSLELNESKKKELKQELKQDFLPEKKQIIEIPLLELPVELLVTSPMEATNDTNDNAQKIKGHFTVHVHSGHTPLAHAHVEWQQKNNHRKSCETNDFGRCQIGTETSPPGTGTVIVNSTGYQSTITTSDFEENANLRIQLSPGQNLENNLPQIASEKIHKNITITLKKSERETKLNSPSPSKFNMPASNPVIDLAKKYIAEHDEKKALELLNQETLPTLAAIEARQFGIELEKTTDEHKYLLRYLQNNLKATAILGFEGAAKIMEINLKLAQCELLTPISDDTVAQGRFHEIGSWAESFANDYPTKKSDQRLPADLMFAVKYIKTLSKQKESISSNDLVTLASMHGEWTELETALKLAGLPANLTSKWSGPVLQHRSDISRTLSSKPTNF